MLILTIRTDKPQSEIGLYDGQTKIDYQIWEAHRQLAETIHLKISDMLKANQKEWSDISGLVYFKGPGSFTGLRIGSSVVNALAGSLEAKVTAETGEDWIEQGIDKLLAGKASQFVSPEYDQLPNVTQPKK